MVEENNTTGNVIDTLTQPVEKLVAGTGKKAARPAADVGLFAGRLDIIAKFGGTGEWIGQIGDFLNTLVEAISNPGQWGKVWKDYTDRQHSKIRTDKQADAGEVSKTDIAIGGTVAGAGLAASALGAYATYKGGKYAVNKFTGGGNTPNGGGGNTPNGGGKDMSLKNAEFEAAKKNGQADLFDGANQNSQAVPKTKNFFGKVADSVKELSGKALKRLPVVGAAATAYGATTQASVASEMKATFQKEANNMSSAERIEASHSIAAQDQDLGGNMISGAAATAGGLGAAFFLASNPVGWTTAAVIGTSMAVGFVAQTAADNITVDGTSLSQWTGQKLTGAFTSAKDWWNDTEAAPTQQAPALANINKLDY